MSELEQQDIIDKVIKEEIMKLIGTISSMRIILELMQQRIFSLEKIVDGDEEALENAILNEDG